MNRAMPEHGTIHNQLGIQVRVYCARVSWSLLRITFSSVTAHVGFVNRMNRTAPFGKKSSKSCPFIGPLVISFLPAFLILNPFVKVTNCVPVASVEISTTVEAEKSTSAPCWGVAIKKIARLTLVSTDIMVVSIVGPLSLIAKLIPSDDCVLTFDVLVAVTAIRAVVVQNEGTVHEKLDVVGPSAGCEGSGPDTSLNGKVSPPSEEKKRSKPLTRDWAAWGTVQVIRKVCPNLSVSVPLGVTRVTGTPRSVMVKFAAVCAVPVAPTSSKAFI